MRYLLIQFLLFILCASPLAATTFTDALGRRVDLSESPQRIVSLSPNVTEVLFALEAEDKLVAVTDACTYPEAATKLPNIGRYADPSVEQILLARPDLVVATADMNRPQLVKRLEKFGIPVYVIYPRSVADTLNTILALGEITGHPEPAAAIVDDFKGRLNRIVRKTADHPPVTTLISVMLEPLVVAGPQTIVGDILSYVGGVNPVPETGGSYPTWNMEALLRLDPEVIVISAHPGQPDPLRWLADWPQLQAVRQQRVYDIEADWLHRPAPRMILGIEALAKALHPDIDFEN